MLLRLRRFDDAREHGEERLVAALRVRGGLPHGFREQAPRVVRQRVFDKGASDVQYKHGILRIQRMKSPKVSSSGLSVSGRLTRPTTPSSRRTIMLSGSS